MKIEELIQKHHNPLLANELETTRLWGDGKITLHTKSNGQSYSSGSSFIFEKALKVNYEMPIKISVNSFMYCSTDEALKIRAAMICELLENKNDA